MIKLYDEDSYIFEFEAVVTSCTEDKGEYKILLDKTAFFPTAGGQECDTGTLNDIRVTHTEIENDKVYHYTKTPIETGKTVIGKLDKEMRQRKMQHHSAEHIVSGLVHSVLGIENVGFHLGDEEVTMDYAKTITPDELLMIEKKANQAVRENLKIICEYPDDEKLKKTAYRSKLDLEENVRLVTIPGIDICACCAPHVKRTGEIGVIKLKDMINYKGGVRVRMICSMDALSDYQKKHENVARISNLLSAKQYEVADAVERVMAELGAERQRSAMLEKSLVAQKAASFEKTDRNICIFEEGISTDALRSLVNIGKGYCEGVCVGLLGSDKEGYTYIIGSNGIDLSPVCKEINESLSGRGGGRGDMISGRFASKKTEITSFFDSFKLK